MKNLPEKYIERMKKLLGEEFAQYEKALSKPPVRAFRVNTSKISLSDFQKLDIFSCGKVPYVEGGFYTEFEKIGNHPYHHAGLIYVQEPGAMAPAECIEIEPDWKVLDMCAAPGGKSTQLKNKLGENGVLVSNEIIPSRCKILTGNIERLGLKNCVTTCMDTAKLARTFPDTFDLIMVDAPCSGEGMMRKEDAAIEEWSEENVLMCAARQKEILENAAACLSGGGYIIYATCTFSLEENEMVIDDFLKRHTEFEIFPVKKEVQDATCDGISFQNCECQNIRFARRFYPHKSRGEGQFMALLHHNGEKNAAPAKREKTPKIEDAVYEFLDDTLLGYKRENVRLYNGNIVYFTPDFAVPEKAAFCLGVTIGEFCKNYIKPHHQFFSAFGKSFKNKIELAASDEKTAKYLHGEEIEVKIQNGWASVLIDGAAVGGAKVVDGRAKNHYPKGLRK